MIAWIVFLGIAAMWVLRVGLDFCGHPKIKKFQTLGVVFICLGAFLVAVVVCLILIRASENVNDYHTEEEGRATVLCG